LLSEERARRYVSGKVSGSHVQGAMPGMVSGNDWVNSLVILIFDWNDIHVLMVEILT